LFALSSIFPCPVYGNDNLYVIFQLWPNDAFVQPQYIVSLTLFTIFLHIVATVKLASFSASTCAHCLEGFALLCIITPKSISYSITFYTRKTHKDDTKCE